MTLTCVAHKSDLIRLHSRGVVFCFKCGKPIVIGELIIVSGSYVIHKKCKI